MSHMQFRPSDYLNKVTVRNLLSKSRIGTTEKVYNKKCVYCGNPKDEGISLNNNELLCSECLEELSYISYPEKYETSWREYLTQRRAREMARSALEDSLSVYVTWKIVGILAAITSLLISFTYVSSLLITSISIYIIYYTVNKPKEIREQWIKQNPEPNQPKLKHFHDPSAHLTENDKQILHIFEHWPGYPPFWSQLKDIIRKRDKCRARSLVALQEFNCTSTIKCQHLKEVDTILITL